MSRPYAERFPDVVEIVVEIRRGSRNKYEFDEEAQVFRLDRVLSSAVFYNFDYGFIEGTRADDGDHTDALLIIDEPTFTGCHVWARPIGGLEMRDEQGFDFKVLCVAIGDSHQQHIERLEQVRPHRLVEIEHFFQTYKLLERKDVEMMGWRDRDRAYDVLVSDRERYRAEGPH
jgi:inorganic pyrophosphatase